MVVEICEYTKKSLNHTPKKSKFHDSSLSKKKRMIKEQKAAQMKNEASVPF